jgi:transcriptional regulator with XRE-family HTH domain
MEDLTPTAMPLSSLLTTLRERAGRGLSETSRAMNLSRQTLWRWENGRRSPDHDELRLLLDLYGATGDEREQAERARRAGLSV